MKESFKITTKKITGTALLTAIELIFIVISNYITIGPVSINLSLIPICLAALLYGPLSGLFLGLVNGGAVLLAPSTVVFLNFAPVATVFLCLLKTGIAGFVSGLVFIPFKNKKLSIHLLGSFLASLLVPVINTGLFLVGCFSFFYPLLLEWAGSAGNIYNFIIVAFIGWNFLIEFLISLLLSPAISQIVKYFSKKK